MDVPAGHCFSTQLIDGHGELSVDGLESFVKLVQLGRCGVSYAVVSIMGPQSAGKSSLLNHLFGTDFLEMDAFTGRCQTTRGLWLAKANGLEPLTIVMDLEGNDGIERAEDDIAFEKQIALFALAVSDVMLINMWCHDIGRDAAANRPLLKTVFTVMMRMFSPSKKTLMFIIRDKTKTPLDLLEEALSKDIQKIWDSIPKPERHQQTPLSSFFNVEVVALSSYEHNEDQFKDQVSSLRKRFSYSTSPGGLAGDRSNATPGSAFSRSATQIWSDIRENKDLQLATHQVMVATYFCEEIASMKSSVFTENKEWKQIEAALQSHEPQPVSDFGRKLKFLNALIDDCLKGYDSETIHFDEGVRSTKGKELEVKLLQLMEPAFKLYLTILRAQTIEEFRNKFDEAVSEGDSLFSTANYCTRQYLDKFRRESAEALIERAKAKWDASEQIKGLESDMDAHIADASQDGLFELTKEFKTTLFEKLLKPTRELLDQANCETWPSIRKRLRDEMELVVSSLSSKLDVLGVDKQKKADLIATLQAYARDLVEKEAKEKANTVVDDMKNRFLKLFNGDSNLTPRIWTGKDDFKAISATAFSASLELLSIRVITYLEANDVKDRIYSTLKNVLLNTKNTKLIPIREDLWASRNWAEVLDNKGSNPSITLVSSSASTESEEASWAVSSKTMIQPSDCVDLWNKFLDEIKEDFTEGKKTWKAAYRKTLRSKIARCLCTAAMETASSALGNFIGLECYRSLHPTSDDDN